MNQVVSERMRCRRIILTSEWLLLCHLRLRQMWSIQEAYKCFVNLGKTRFALDTRLQALAHASAVSRPCFQVEVVVD